jgi:death-on-curing protein
MEFRYFTIEYAIKTHDKIIDISGGLSGLKNIGDLESPLEHIKNDMYYPEVEDKVTHFFLCK